MYSSKVLDHFRHPRNVGEIENPTAVVEVTNPVCGDVMKLWAVVSGGVLTEVKFKTVGCVPAVACGSWLTEAVLNKKLDGLGGVAVEQIEAGLGGLPSASRHAAVLAADCLERLLENLQKRPGKP